MKNPMQIQSIVVLFALACNSGEVDEKSIENETEQEEKTEQEEWTGDTPDSLFDVSEYDSGVYTFAGSGEYVSVDGIKEGASFADPIYMREGPDGWMYILDRMTGTIRRMSLDGTVESLSFQGPQPRDPIGFDFAENGDLYVASSDEHCIYKISQGSSSVFAGTCSVEGNDGAAGYEDGAQAKFHFPKEIVFDLDGNLIVADASNSRIRSITPNGVTSTIAGTDGFGLIEDGPALSSIAYFPISVTVDADNNIYFSGLDNCVRRIVDGELETLAGLCQNYSNVGTDDGDALDARFDLPRGLYFNSSDELMIADASNSRIRVLSSDFSEVSTLAGTVSGFADGPFSEAAFDYPSSLVEIDGAYLVTDSVNGRIRLLIP